MITQTGDRAGKTIILPGMVFLAERIANVSSVLDFIGIFSAEYLVYQFEFIGLVVSADADIYMRSSTDNGVTFDAGENYTNAALQSNQGTFVGALNGGATDAFNLICNSVEATANSLDGWIKLYNPLNTSFHKKFVGQTITVKGDGNTYLTAISGRYNSNSAVNATRFLPSTGTLTSGRIRVYGLR